MKFLMSAVLMVASVNAMAYGSIVFPGINGESVEVAWLGTKVDENQLELAWESGGQDAVFNGDICFKGTRTEAVQVLEYLDLNDFMGDEYRLRNIHYVGKDRIAYEIYDGPSESVANELVIFSCK